MRETIHCSLSVRGALRWNQKQLRGLLTDQAGHKLSPREAREALMQMLSEGVEMLPLGDCDGFDPKTGCPGHAAPPEDDTNG